MKENWKMKSHCFEANQIDEGTGMKEGWEIRSVGDCCLLTKNLKWTEGSAETYKYIDLSSVCRNTLKITSSASISNGNAPSRAKKIIARGDVIFATTRPTLRRVAKVTPDYDRQICSTGYTVMRPEGEKLSTSYLFYYIQTEFFMERMEKLQRGASYPAVTDADVKGSEIPIPPLAEQEAIVAILDKAFTAIDQAKANIEQNIANAKELFQSKLNQIFSQKGEGWEEKPIADLCESIIDCINKTAPKVEEVTEYKMLRTTNIRHGKVSLERVNYVTEKTYQQWTRRQTPRVGDVLFTREAPLGEAGILTSEDKVFLGQRIVSYRVDSSKLDNRFLLFSFQSPPMQKQIADLGSGATVQHMRVPDTKKLMINHPDIQTQKEIVEEMVQLLAHCETIVETYQTKLASLDELKKSILQKAFAGELT